MGIVAAVTGGIGARILLVEDNELNQQVAMELLTQAGFYVDLAENGEAAVSMVAVMPSSQALEPSPVGPNDVIVRFGLGYEQTAASLSVEPFLQGGIPSSDGLRQTPPSSWRARTLPRAT